MKASLADRTGRTPLHFAASHGNEEMAMSLFLFRADPEREDAYGQTPVFFAKNRAILELLVDRKDVNTHKRNHFGQTCLHVMSFNGAVKCLQ